MARVRFASPNEQRAISRQHCGFYNAVVIGAIYEFSGSRFDVTSSQSFFGAAKRCIDRYPTLSVVVRDMHTDASFFERVPTINLEDHISIVGEVVTEDDAGDELTKIEKLLPSILDRPWPEFPPPWRIVVLPLSSSREQGKEITRCFIAFSFSHALGDAIIALAFHRTFRDGIFDQVGDDCSALATPLTGFPAAFDTAETLPISWSFLLGPLIAVLLPKSVAEMLGLRATDSAVNSGTWTGARMFFNPESFHSCHKLIEIHSSVVDKLLRVARNNGAKLTAVIHQCMVRALSKEIPRGNAANFVSSTAVNMRRSVGLSNDEMGLFVNACYGYHEREDDWASPWSEKAWASARSLTEKLAKCAVTLQDQPLGLLRYIPSISKWTAGKMGKERDDSYEVSNLGVFEAVTPPDPAGDDQCNITKLVFCQPANATSSPLMVSIASVKGGSMVISIGWQPGALGIPRHSESAFVEKVSRFLKEDLEALE